MATVREKMQNEIWRQKNPDYAKNWYQENREEQRAKGRKRYQENREKYQQKGHFRRFAAIEALGGKCVHCGEDDLLVLQIDHIVDLHLVGKKRPKSERGHALHRKILLGNKAGKKAVENLQILCANCHLRKTMSAHIQKDHTREDIIKNAAEFRLNRKKVDLSFRRSKCEPVPELPKNIHLPPIPKPPGAPTPGAFQPGHGAGQITPGAGVKYRADRKQWVASIQVFGKQHERGFATEAEARECRRKMEYGDIPPPKPKGKKKKITDPGW